VGRRDERSEELRGEGVQGSGDPVASSGDPKHPYTVPIRDDISSEAPHLPGKPAPRTCTDSGEPIARKKEREAPVERERERGGEGEGEGSTKREDDSEREAETPKRHAGPAYARLWLGIAGAVDFLNFPAASDVCKIAPASGLPANSSKVYCTSADGTDFPPRTNPQGRMQNDALVPGQSGTTPGGLMGGNDVQVKRASRCA